MTIEKSATYAASAVNSDLQRLNEGRLHDPSSVLGLHDIDRERRQLRVALPHAVSARIAGTDLSLTRVATSVVFECIARRADLAHPVEIEWTDGSGRAERCYDPYSFALQLEQRQLDEFGGGRHTRAQLVLGSHLVEIDGVRGVRFAAWAPNAERVSVVGDFNRWDGRTHPMRVRGASGVWELFVPALGGGELYKYEIRNRDSGRLLLKTDPYAVHNELRPANASVTPHESRFVWRDDKWMRQRRLKRWLDEAISVYELHLGSWRRGANGEFLNYRDIASQLAPYVRQLGFTHVELLPITEHPFDDSWGYQTTGFFAPTSRFGTPDDLRAFVSTLHEHGIGVILDWVPGHFPRDAHALAEYDGSKLYEYADTRKGEHPDWQTLVFDYTRNEVRSFLLSSAVYWLEAFHFDAIRVDAVASMLYLDYSRKHGQWEPNMFGSNENLEAVAFLKLLNETTHREAPGTFTIAEESTAWPKVSRPTYDGGLGFTFKWNMGWMHDTLEYMKKDPVHRSHHHNLLTFGPIYAFTENFMLPLSHDEVVHGKGSLLGRMPGDEWQRFANLRLLLTFQWTYPGKKLLFMGGELAQPWEWSHRSPLPWHLLEQPLHAGVSALLGDLNRIYRSHPALQRDCDDQGFYWLSWEDRSNSVLSFARRDGDDHVLIVLNFTPVPREGYRIGAPFPGRYREVLNSDSAYYGGSNIGNQGLCSADAIPAMGQARSLALNLPPLGGIVLVREPPR